MAEPQKQSGFDAFPEIPGYRIEETLGRGSTGVVFRATQLAVDRQVAIKVLHPELAGRSKAVRRLQREAKATARLSHPNIVHAIDMGQCGPLWWYAMELVEGESLAQRLERTGPLTEREAVRLFAPLVEALDHAFEKGVVHRDIKPANVLIDRSGRARLADLGLAFTEDDPLLTRVGAGTMGTPHYVSPEQARSPTDADVRSDIWSLGATLYHAVCGRPPFSGESVAEILSGVLYARVPDPAELAPHLSRDFALVLRKCLSRDPDKRYQRPGELLADLERLRERRHVSVRRSALDPVQRRGSARRRAYVGGAAALLLALVAVALVVQRRERGDGAGAAPAEQRWVALERVARRAEQPGVRLATVLAELEELGPPPEGFRARHAEVHAELQRAFREAIVAFSARLQADLERMLQERDLVGAQRLLDEGLVPRIRRELDPGAAQLRSILERIDLAALQQRVSTELDLAIDALSRRLAEHEAQVVALRVRNLREAGAWREARAELLRPVEEHLAEARIAVGGLPPLRVADVLRARRAGLDQQLSELDAAWRVLDGELADFVQREADAIADRLQRRVQERPPAADLDEAFARRLRELRLAPRSMPTEVSDLARTALLERAAQLEELEARLLVEDAQRWYADRFAEAEPLWRERRYARIAELWEQGLEQAWLRPIHDQARVQRLFARLLQDLLEAAAARVTELDGQRTSLLVGSIVHSGVVEAGPDPLREGFRLASTGAGTLLLALRALDGERAARAVLLGPDPVEELAGIAGDPGALDEPLARMRKALFRLLEGDVATAARALPLLPPDDPAWLPVAAEITRRINASEEKRAAARAEREREALDLIHLVQREGRLHTGDADAIVRSIDQLLARFGDLEVVRARSGDLRDLRERLLAPRTSGAVEALREALGPARVELSGSRASMGFDFGAGGAGRWSRGTWIADAEGWFAPGLSSREQVLDDNLWPRLVLRPPVDLDAAMEVELDLEQLRDSGLPQLLVVSVAGVHVALRGPDGEHGGRWLIGSGGPAELRQLVLDALAGRGEPFAGLQRGGRHRVRVELTQGRGRASVYLDGALLGHKDAPRPEGQPGTASIVVRSIEPVKLLGARVETRLR